MSVKQYPHIATVIITADGGTDAKGYPLPPVENTITLVCRAEPNSSNAIIYTGDGKAYSFKYVVYIKAGQSEAPVGSHLTMVLDAETGAIIFTDGGQALVADDNTPLTTNDPVHTNSGIVKMYSKGQLNARLWV